MAIIAAAIACSNGGAPSADAGSGGNGAGSGGLTGTGGAGAGGGTGTGGSGPSGTGGGSPAGGGSNGTGGGSSSGGGGNGSGGASSGGGDVPGTSGYDCSPASGDIPALQATPVGTGLQGAILVAHEPDAPAGRLFVLEVTGVIRIIENGTVLGTPFLDFSSKVGVATSPGAAGDERGALGLAFHPAYATNGLFYVHHSDTTAASPAGDSIVEEYHVSSDPNVADPESARLVLKITQPPHGGSLRNHKGGAINFGADSYLYLGFGDGGGSDDPMGNGQSLNTLLGKILRIDPVASGGNAYSSPSGNVAGGLPEIWDYGLRNPFRFTFDGCTGDLYIGDVGQNTREEVDIEKVGEGNKNYGWNITEGLGCRPPATTCSDTGMVDPVLDYGRGDGQSITGGAVYRGSAIPGLRGTYFYADYQANKIWSVKYDREAGTVSAPVTHTQDLNNVTRVVAITNGPDGELYFTSIAGGVYKLEAAE